MPINAYQTLENRDNPDEIQENGPFMCTRKHAWLGDGYYFWDSNIDWASEWGEKCYPDGYVICEAQIIMDERCFDLVGNIAHQVLLRKLIDELKNSGYLNDKEIIYFSKIIQFMKDQNIFDYDAIRVNDNKEAIDLHFVSRRREFTTILKRIQICLINKSKLVPDSYKIVYPENYKRN